MEDGTEGVVVLFKTAPWIAQERQWRPVAEFSITVNSDGEDFELDFEFESDGDPEFETPAWVAAQLRRMADDIERNGFEVDEDDEVEDAEDEVEDTDDAETYDDAG